jgi:short-subunit dehydrogenase involved in D-alanine esterification of teichoic acids
VASCWTFVSNAAVLLDAEGVLDLTAETAVTLETNLIAPIRVTRAFLPLLEVAPAARDQRLSGPDNFRMA